LHGPAELVAGDTRFRRPTSNWDDPSEAQDDIFGLDSTLYMILTGKEPFEEVESGEVTARFQWAKSQTLATFPSMR